MYFPPTTNCPKAPITCPAAGVPSLPCNRMRRLLANPSDRRKRVKSRRTEGNTENCTGRVMYIATSSTRTEAVRLADNRMSRAKVGNGTNITNTRATAIKGTTQSRFMPLLLIAGAGLGGAGFIVQYLPIFPWFGEGDRCGEGRYRSEEH